MYKAILTGNVPEPITFFNIYNTGANGNTVLTSARLQKQAGKAGTFTFTMPPTHPYIDDFEKLASYVDVYRDDDIIFSGRVYEQQKNINSMMTITCEGLLAVFNDTVARPGTYNVSLTELLEILLTSHNAQVTADKQIQLGTVSISDEYLYREYENYASTMERLKKLADDYGAYLEVRKTNGQLFLDFVGEYTHIATQTIDFGQNLLSLTQDSKTTDLISVIVPLGAQTEGEGQKKSRVTIKDVNEGRDYIENPEAVSKIGRVCKIMTWDDVTIPANLYAKAEAYLNDMSRSRVTITAGAIDMASANSSVEAWKLGDNVLVNASALGIYGQRMTITGQTIDLLNPAQNKLTLGEDVVGYVSQTQRTEDKYGLIIEEILSDYSVDEALEQLKQITGDNSGNISELQNTIATLRSEISQMSDSITLSVQETISDVETRLVQAMTTAVMELTAEQWKVLFEQAGYGAWLRFDADGYLIIGRSDSPIQSRQSGSSYEFYDTSTGESVLKMDTDGATMPSVNVSEQLRFTSGSLGQWVIRKGEAHGLGYNLDDVWIGG